MILKNPQNLHIFITKLKANMINFLFCGTAWLNLAAS